MRSRVILSYLINMLSSIILTITPTILFYILIRKTGLKIKSKFLLISLSWFAGQYIFTFLTFFIAISLSFITTNILLKASLISLLIFHSLLAVFYKNLSNLFISFFKNFKTKKILTISNFLLITFCLLFSYFFFIPHLTFQNGAIYTSPIYWDFHWQADLMQTFVYGDNFPPENEAFAGVPHGYHFFWMVNASIYQVMGLGLVNAINFVSIINFFFVLITLIGLAKEFFNSKLAGFIAALLAVTSSSLHFFDYFKDVKNQNFWEIIRGIITNSNHPWPESFVRDSYSFVYNGTFYNLFYFIEERQMILGIVFLFLSIFIIYKRNELSKKTLLLFGGLMGGYFLWHLHITLMVLAAIVFIFVFGDNRKKTFYLLTGFGIVFLIHYLYIKGLASGEWYLQKTETFPKINFQFSDQENKSFSVIHALRWYWYSYGIKLILIPISLFVLFKENKKKAIAILSIILPTFLILNTIQISPNSIYENHKFLRPMNMAVDLAVGVGIFLLFFKKTNILKIIGGILIIILLTLSGFIELMPFVNSKPDIFYEIYPSVMAKDIRKITAPKSVFVGEDNKDIYLAGRKLFVANSLRGHDEDALKKSERKRIINAIYQTTNKLDLCTISKKYKIDYIQYWDSNSNGFSTINAKGDKIFFLSINGYCKP